MSLKPKRLGEASAPRCPACDQELTAEEINIKEGVGLCPSCGKLSRLSELNHGPQSMEEMLDNPPQGCSVTPWGQGAVVRVSSRSVGGFFAAAGFALFWNGIVSIFVLIAVAGLYTNLVGPLPEWFPSPVGSEAGKVEAEGSLPGLGMTLFLCVFLIPFVLVGMFMVWTALFCLFGITKVSLDALESYVSTGIGFLSWKRRFDANQVREILITEPISHSEGRSTKVVEIRADKTIKFGSGLSAEKQAWTVAVMNAMLLGKGHSRATKNLPMLHFLQRRNDGASSPWR
ncbi:MAG TPA: hypothetical protein PKD64_04250 [Pirellulaceae bacterium]|nr:hypothetical protein [Pirellulaceae bacterium]HMO91384.1 hypothetical protein [Pirellulaceae bacterium]HMP69609.1 hypothetical protein [Pirellulaceae bacterium]